MKNMLFTVIVALAAVLALGGTAQAVTRVSGKNDGAVAFVAPGDPTNMGLGYYTCNGGPLAMSATSFLRVWPSPAYANLTQEIAVIPYFQYFNTASRTWVNWGYGAGRKGAVPAGGRMAFAFNGAYAFQLARGWYWRVWYDIRWLVNGTEIGQAWYTTADDMYHTGGLGYNTGWCGL